ncbi:MAG TPA: zinc transporter ZupT [Ruminococcaceae bacterium]|nr:zinc transporter ZupT [Oscillospiraceae bacterium]
MQAVSQAFLLTMGAGLATAVGSLTILFSKKENKRFLAFSLGVAAGVMIFVSIGDLLPEAKKYLAVSLPKWQANFMALCFLGIGIFCAFGIDRLLPHFQKITGGARSNSLARVGMVTAVAVTLHNLPEGMATFLAGYTSLQIGLPVAVSIALHNIPEGIAVAAPIYYGTGKRAKAFVLSVLSGLSEPLGAVLAFTFLRPFLTSATLGILFAWVSGIMLYLSFAELLPAAEESKHTGFAVLGIFGGISFMQLALIWF